MKEKTIRMNRENFSSHRIRLSHSLPAFCCSQFRFNILRTDMFLCYGVDGGWRGHIKMINKVVHNSGISIMRL